MTNEPQEARTLEIPEVVSDLGYTNDKLGELISVLEERLGSVLSDTEQPTEEPDQSNKKEKRTELGRNIFAIKISLRRNFDKLEDLKNRLEV